MPGLVVSRPSAHRHPSPASPPSAAPGSRGGTLPSPLTGRVRLVRVAALGGLSLLLATGAHLAGGGSLPGPGVLLVTAVLLGLLAAVVTARRCRFWLLSLLLAGQQLVLHELFGAAGRAAGCAVDATGTAHAAGAAHLMVSCSPISGGMEMTAGGPAWAMVAGHLVAVLATAWLLARGETWWWRTVDRAVVAAGLSWVGPVLRGLRDRPAVPALSACSSAGAWRPAAPRGPPPVRAR